MKLHHLTPAALGLLVLLASCQQATDDEDSSSFGSTQALTVTATSAVTYWDLDTGTQVTDPASTTWDIALTSATGGVFTNGGATATAAASSGTGAVYYSGSTVFDEVTSYNSSSFSSTWSTDTTVYVATASQSGTSTSTAVLNKMTALDYSGGTGTEADPYTNDASAGVYDGEAYYAYDSTSHAFSASGEVYLLRSGDGSKVFKVQITSLSGSNASRVRDIKYAVYQ